MAACLLPMDITPGFYGTVQVFEHRERKSIVIMAQRLNVQDCNTDVRAS